MTNEQLTRLRVLFNTLINYNVVDKSDAANVAVVGECNVPCAHIIYYFIGLDYYLAIRTTKTPMYKQLLIDSQTEESRQTIISKWLYTDGKVLNSFVGPSSSQ